MISSNGLASLRGAGFHLKLNGVPPLAIGLRAAVVCPFLVSLLVRMCLPRISLHNAPAGHENAPMKFGNHIFVIFFK